MLLPSFFYIIEDVRGSKKFRDEEMEAESGSRRRMKEFFYGLGRLIIIVAFPLWPLVIFLSRTHPLVRFYWKTGTDKRKYKEKLEKICQMVVSLSRLGIRAPL